MFSREDFIKRFDAAAAARSAPRRIADRAQFLLFFVHYLGGIRLSARSVVLLAETPANAWRYRQFLIAWPAGETRTGRLGILVYPTLSPRACSIKATSQRNPEARNGSWMAVPATAPALKLQVVAAATPRLFGEMS
jgi:hypothetical protein